MQHIITPREMTTPQWRTFIGAFLGGLGALIVFLGSSTIWLQLFGLGFAFVGLGLVVAAAMTPKTTIEDAVAPLLEHDSDCLFVTDEDGNILRRNATCVTRFGDAANETIVQAFGSLLAAPEAILYRLQTGAKAEGSAKEDVVTRSAQFRLAANTIAKDRYLWRLDERNTSYAPLGRGPDALTIPMLTMSATGTVLFMNETFRRVLGTRSRNVADVFVTAPLVNGHFNKIKSASGEIPCVVAQVQGPAGRTEVYAILAEQRPAHPAPRTEVLAGWDAIEDLPVPLLKIGADGSVLASNREGRCLLGVSSTEGRRMVDLIEGLGRPVNDWIREAIEGRGGNISQFLRGRGEAQDIFVQVTLNAAVGPDNVRHLIAVLHDVTELKTLEGQFVQSQKMQAIGQLAGGVAHDFNNLLTAISGHCDLLLLRHDEGDQDYGDLIQIHQNANRAASLVGQLLAFSRKQNLQPEVIHLRDTLSDLTHLLNRLVGEKVFLTLHHDQDLAPIKADKRQLEQVLMNLVVNARDAMPEGGEIRIETENLTLKEQLERDRAIVPPGRYVVVKVVDEGVGIAPEKLHKIFEPFYTTKRTGEGTGLGLSTAYGIVKQTGGYIFADSIVTEGTTFILLFPTHEIFETDDVYTPVAQRRAPLPEMADGVVLLVEDEAPVRAFASRALRLRGYTVLEADCAEAALSLLADPELNVDIFVTDVIMPGMDGPTWVREALNTRPQTKVVFVSGYAEDAFLDGEIQIPNSVFLPKPFSLNDLTMTVHKQLS